MTTPTMSNNGLNISLNNNNVENIVIDYDVLERSVSILRAINHQLRQDIIKLLDASEGLTVTEIYVKLRIEQSVASQHLAILRKAGIVNADRDGKYIHYTLNIGRIKEISALMTDLVNI